MNPSLYSLEISSYFVLVVLLIYLNPDESVSVSEILAAKPQTLIHLCDAFIVSSRAHYNFIRQMYAFLCSSSSDFPLNHSFYVQPLQ